MDATFRIRRSDRNPHAVCVLACLALATLGGYLALTPRPVEPDVRDRLALAATMGGIGLVGAGWSLSVLAACWRQELTIRGRRVTFRRVFRRTELDLNEVTEARWLTRLSGGGLVLRGGPARISLQFAHYEPEDTARITEYIRSTLPPGVQSGWNLFAYKVASHERRSVRRKPGPDEVLIPRKRWDRYLMAFLPITGLIGIIGWWSTGEWSFLIAPSIPPLLGWGLMRSTTPADGMVVPKLLTPDSAGFLGFLLFWFLVAIAGFAAHAAFRTRLAHPDAVAIVGGIIWLGILLVEAALQDHRQVRRDREAADLAANARGEAGANTWTID